MKSTVKIGWVLAPVALVALACGVDPAQPDSGTFQPGVGASPTSAAQATTAAAAPSPTKPAEPPAPKVPTIGEGIWTVGEDVEPGTYKVAEAAEDYCYWAILDDEGNIIDNYLGAGKPKVTIKNGQQFETANCPIFEKVG